MKVVISTDRGKVSSHFGRCPSFTIIEVEDAHLRQKKEIPNPGHHPGFLPEFFHNQGIQYIICGGMGRKAQNLFAQKEIKFILGVQGNIDEVIENLLKGELEGGESLCQPGKGKGYGVSKTERPEN